MSIIAGTSGAFSFGGTGQSTCAEWSINPKKTTATATASNTATAQVIVPGNADWTGRARVYGKTPGVYPGDSGSFVGYNGAKSYTANGIIGKVSGKFDIKSGAYIAWDIEIMGNGAITRGATTVTDASAPKTFVASPCKFNWAGSDIPGVQAFSLEIMRATPEYVAAQVVQRVTGGVLSASFTVDQLEADSTTQIQEGAIEIAKFYVDASTFFQFSYGIIESVEQNVPIESGEIVPYRLTGKFTGWKVITGTNTQGTIIKPDTTAFWP